MEHHTTKKMRDIHRHIHFDFHTMPGIDDFNRDWDAAAFAQRLADAHVDYINFAAICNLGFSYYKTKLGIPYKGMKGDMLEDILRECHARGIGVTAYINAQLMHELSHLHPEWCRVNKRGSATLSEDRVEDNFFRMMCFNSKGYYEHLIGVIKEICSYDIDGLFCDCMRYYPCHCKDCTEEMIARGIDIEDEVAVYNFSKEVEFRVAKEIKEIVGPDRYLYMNGMPPYEYRDIITHMEVECLPSYGLWGYDYLWPTAAMGRSLKDTGIYMTGRFQHSWGDFGGYKTKESIESDLYDGLCNNMIPSVGDHMHPAGLPEKDIYEDIKDIYGRLMKYEPYTEGAKYVAEVAVLTDFSKAGKLATLRGLGRMFGELKIAYNILHVDMDFSDYKLVVLPDRVTVTEDCAKRLEEYVSKGGNVLFTGFSGVKTHRTFEQVQRATECSEKSAMGSEFVTSLIPATYEGVDTSNSSYFDFVTVPKGSASMSWETYEEGILLKAKCESDVRAYHVRPYFDKHWDGRQGFFYTPPKERSGYDMAVCDGKVGYIAFRVFDAYYTSALREHKRLVEQFFDELLPNRLIKPMKGIPTTARVTVTATEKHHLLHVKVTFPEPRGLMHIVEEHGILPAGAEVAVQGKFGEVCLLPSETPVESRVENGYTVVTLPQITGYDMFRLR